MLRDLDVVQRLSTNAATLGYQWWLVMQQPHQSQCTLWVSLLLAGPCRPTGKGSCCSSYAVVLTVCALWVGTLLARPSWPLCHSKNPSQTIDTESMSKFFKMGDQNLRNSKLNRLYRGEIVNGEISLKVVSVYPYLEPNWLKIRIYTNNFRGYSYKRKLSIPLHIIFPENSMHDGLCCGVNSKPLDHVKVPQHARGLWNYFLKKLCSLVED